MSCAPHLVACLRWTFYATSNHFEVKYVDFLVNMSIFTANWPPKAAHKSLRLFPRTLGLFLTIQNFTKWIIITNEMTPPPLVFDLISSGTPDKRKQDHSFPLKKYDTFVNSHFRNFNSFRDIWVFSLFLGILYVNFICIVYNSNKKRNIYFQMAEQLVPKSSKSSAEGNSSSCFYCSSISKIQIPLWPI